ncbi:hypothetical protein [Curvivirga aplysinae]|uniref:hypothetical protein n=1 Tax=Curvivirga aplysinae TaxID=2529852 RepID=UPI0012BC4FEC|nr:hypothetical protein [Curvivirga aplysinae]MTI11094.1 hypothetical protein [Curvivirga aplysinae]
MAITVNGGAAAASMLNVALSKTKPGEFKPKTSAVTNIQTTLSQNDVNANNRLIMNSAINRLNGIAQGIVEPNQDREWEVVGAYLQATGQPYQIKIATNGALSVEAQADGKLDDFNQAQKLGIANAIQKFDSIAIQVDQETARNGYLNSYNTAAARLIMMQQFAPAQDPWEIDFQRYAELGRPVQVGLNGQGEIVAINQLEHDFSEVENVDDRLKLIAARNELSNILDGTSAATEAWHYLALGNKQDGDDYLIVLDDDGNVTVRNNLHRDTPSSQLSLNHITPQFLKDDFKVETSAQWQEDAANLYRQGKGFYFDFDNTGTNIVTRELNLTYAMNLHKPVDRTQDIINAQLSILT